MITHTTEENVVFIYEINSNNTHELCEALMSFDEQFLVRRTDTITTTYYKNRTLKNEITKVIIETTEEMYSVPDCVKYIDNYIRKVEVNVSN